MDYIDKIKELRVQRGLTQVQLSLALGLSRSTYGLYETRQRRMDVEMFYKICKYFNVNPNDLLKL